jgi:YgiT-type zinc finger domain-containing protein
VNAACSCKQIMDLTFTTIVHDQRIEITNVPIWECETCGVYEVFPELKPALIELVDQLKNEPGSVRIVFNEYNELADIMYEMYEEYKDSEMDAGVYTSEVMNRSKERINLLLDVYGYASNNEDRQWMDSLMARLSQITCTPAGAT